jgi:hypothetical protein
MRKAKTGDNMAVEAIVNPAPLKLIQPTRNHTSESKKEIARQKAIEKATIASKEIKTLCAFDRHIHGRSNRYIYDKKRVAMIRARRKEGKTMEECAQAIIGLRFSAWHQGTHPGNMVGIANYKGEIGRTYDDVEYIFQDVRSFEGKIGHAKEALIYAVDAKHELEAFLIGKPSQYAKKIVKEAQRTLNEQRKVSDADVLIRNQYLSFASSIVQFFKTLDVPAIKEMCQSNSSLRKAGKGITEDDYLFQSLIQVFQTFQSNVPKDVETKMKKFSGSFCEYQKLNVE